MTLVLGFMLTFAQPPSGASAASGDLDQTFGRGGKVTTDLGLYWNGASDLAIQTDGKIVAAGEVLRDDLDMKSAQDFALVRYHPDGTVDAGFGNNGVVTTDFGSMEGASAIAIQLDGKIVVAGRTYGGACGCNDFALARYNSNGTLDSQFAGTGTVTTSFGSVARATGVVIAPDGKIVAVGEAEGDFALARYEPDGTLDAGFGFRGKVTTNFALDGIGTSSVAEDVVIQDGKIVVAGSASFPSAPNGPGSDFALARYHSNGSLDTGFGLLGKVVTDFGGDDYGRSVAVQSDKFVVGGASVRPGQQGSESDSALARYNADGTLDDGLLNGGGFGTGGRVITDLGGSDIFTGLVIQGDRKIVAAGGAKDFAVTRYEPDGSVDGGFGTGGTVTTDFAGGEDFASGVVIQAGKIVLAGTSDGSFAVARYLSDDGLDTVAPETTIISGPPATTTDDTPTFEFTSTEAGSSFECRVDSLAFTPCTSPYTTQSLDSGSHAFEVRATDPAGNADGTPAKQSFTVEAPVEIPALSIADTSAKEGNGGNKNFGFTVTLSRSSSDSVTVGWTTANGTAAIPEDYSGATGSLTFTPGEMSKVVTVLVNGDRTRESNETFSVNLTSPTNATIADNQATGTIVNDD
jgi:uncharacterized delta-60 repeat protein